MSLKTLLFILIFITLLIGIGAFWYSKNSIEHTPSFDIPSILTQAKESVDSYLYLEKLIISIVETYGIKAGLMLIDSAEAEAVIDNDGCHALLHYVGHAAYNYYGNDFETITAPVAQSRCIGGYLHGVEAEILLASDTAVNDIKKFCSFTKEKGITPGSCYHGVGHAAAELYDYNPNEALASCDALAGGPEPDLTNCYRGVFSEIGNVVLGIDGHTGRDRERVALFGLTGENAYTWCNTFEERHRSSCKSQLTKLLFTGMRTDDWFLVCLDEGFSNTDMNICTNIVASTYIRNEFSANTNAPFPAAINELPQEAQKIAVLGALESFNGFLADGKQRDYEATCESFSNTEVQNYCFTTFTNYLETKEGVWLQRSDIR